jgi:hypothetical protein
MNKKQNGTTPELELSAFRNEKIFPGCDNLEVKQAFLRAIVAVRKDLGKRYSLYIGGKEIVTNEA